MTKPDKMHELGLAVEDWLVVNPRQEPSDFWTKDGVPRLDYDLLARLLSIPVANAEDTTTGRFAAALDLWIAHELVSAGFEERLVWPRASEPRGVDPHLIEAVERGVPERDAALRSRLLRLGGARADVKVMGSVFLKQVDVGLSSWPSGPELLVSTKTMGGSFGKNLANRFEEAYGDVRNLRGRHPLAAHGFFFVARSTILDEPSAFGKVVHMLRRLAGDEDVYDAAALLLASWGDAGPTGVSLPPELNDRVPDDLRPEGFFSRIVDLVLARAPIDAHAAARSARGLS